LDADVAWRWHEAGYNSNIGPIRESKLLRVARVWPRDSHKSGSTLPLTIFICRGWVGNAGKDNLDDPFQGYLGTWDDDLNLDFDNQSYATDPKHAKLSNLVLVCQQLSGQA